VYDGRVFKLDEHLQRLIDSAKAMAFEGEEDQVSWSVTVATAAADAAK